MTGFLTNPFVRLMAPENIASPAAELADWPVLPISSLIRSGALWHTIRYGHIMPGRLEGIMQAGGMRCFGMRDGEVREELL